MKKHRTATGRRDAKCCHWDRRYLLAKSSHVITPEHEVLLEVSSFPHLQNLSCKNAPEKSSWFEQIFKQAGHWCSGIWAAIFLVKTGEFSHLVKQKQFSRGQALKSSAPALLWRRWGSTHTIVLVLNWFPEHTWPGDWWNLVAIRVVRHSSVPFCHTGFWSLLCPCSRQHVGSELGPTAVPSNPKSKS